jgi:hypothetical protein
MKYKLRKKTLMSTAQLKKKTSKQISYTPIFKPLDDFWQIIENDPENKPKQEALCQNHILLLYIIS